MKKINGFMVVLIVVLFMIPGCEKNLTALNALTTYQWDTALPQEHGLDPEVLNAAFQEAENRPFIDAILIIKGGFLVTETYFNGYGPEKAHNVRSVSKSFLSALTGIAFREGVLDSLNQKMIDFFPAYIYDGMDQRKFDITIRDLLMMRMGIDHEHNNYMQIYATPNWIRSTIELPLVYNPGTHFCYNTFQTHLLSAIITRASGESTLSYGTKNLFNPMQITVDHWEQGPQGYYFGGNNMFFTPRNMAVLGYLYLNNGRLEGEQVVPEEWVSASLTNYTGFAGNQWGELKNYNYGYLWWLGEMKNYEVFLAIGHGGQFVINFPELQMVIVTTSDAYVDWDTADAHEQSILDLVANYILPAVQTEKIVSFKKNK